jgi:hypothetical protein
MWVRKSPESIAADMAECARPPRLLPALAIAAAATVGLGVLYALGFRGYSRGVLFLDSTESSQEALGRRPWILLVPFAIIFWLVYRRRKSPESLVGSNTTLLCTRCFEPHSPYESQCPCGGELEPIVFWEWMEDEEERIEERR